MCIASAAGFFILTVAFLACGVGFLAPHWVYFPADFIDRHGFDHLRSFVQAVMGKNGRLEYDGLLGRCYAPGSKCMWFWEDDFAMEKAIKDWHKASQAMYSFGYVILLSTLLLALLHLFCRCCCRKPFSLASVIGALIVAGSLLVATAIALFMAFQIKDHEVNIDNFTEWNKSAHFDWGCFIAVGGVVGALISAIFFIYEGCHHNSSRSYEGYETARTI